MTTSTSRHVVRAAAEETGRDPADLPPIYEAIDPEALDALFSRRNDGRSRGSREADVRFRYAGLDVRVSGDGEVTVRTAGNPPP